MMSWIEGLRGSRTAVLLGMLAGLPLAAFQPPAHPATPPNHSWFVPGAGGSYLGVSIAEVDAERARALKLPAEEGVEISRVEADSPADKAGLKVGDVVLEYNGERVEGMEQFGRMVHETPAGRKVTLKVSRGGAMQTLTAVIGTRTKYPQEGFMVIPRLEMPPFHMPDMPEGFPAWRSGMLGIETEALNPQLADFFGVKQGVLIRSVLNGSPAEKAGIKAGDVLTRVEDQDVTTPGQVSTAIQAARTKHSVSLKLVRNRHEMSITATLDDDHSEWLPSPEADFIHQLFPR